MAEPSDLEALWAAFCSPPDDARPRAWWHWMDGNVDPDGIRLDLEWLQRVGVRGVQQFDGGMGTPLVVPEPVLPGSPAWSRALRLAAETADRLGLDLTVATSAGWSAAGGPWVEPADAMKKIVWSEVLVAGGGSVELRLPALPDVAGPYQDLPRWGEDASVDRFSVDWRVLAMPAPPAARPLRPDAVVTSHPADTAALLDGRFDAAVRLPRDPERESCVWIEQRFDERVEIAAVTAGFPGPSGFGAAPPPSAVLEASDDGVAWTAVAELPATNVPVRTASFPTVAARRFRLRLTGASAASTLPPVAQGVRRPPVLRASDAFLVSELALFPAPRVDAAEVKAGFGTVLDYDSLPEGPSAGAIDPSRVVDLTSRVEDGVLRWDVPEGSWLVLRLGASPTGHRNGPAPAEATGLEVDKLDAAAVRRYLETHLGRFEAALGSGLALHGLLSDSIESGPQSWTPRLAERFVALRGYDPTPWLPALAGYLVGDSGSSDRFLADHRRTVADLVASEYYGTVAAVAHEHGLTYYAEALEDHRPQLGSDLAMRAAADVPMGAMWTFDPEEAPKPTYVADLRGAASVAHVFGKPFTGAESMTAFHRPWSSTPKRLKHVADLELALGVTRFCIHTSPHQPVAAPPPGIGLAPFLGQVFTRLETWAELAGPWIDYLARCSFLLNRGEPAVEVAVLIGEEGPLTALFGEAEDDAVPGGFAADYVDTGGLAALTVDDGVLVAAGARYRVLALGGASDRLSVPTLRRLVALAEAGAVIAGSRPSASSSLADDPAEHRRLCDRLWGGERTAPLVRAQDAEDALRALGIDSELLISGAETRVLRRLLHGDQVAFVSNPRDEAVTVELTGRMVVAPLAAWDPVALRRVALPVQGGRARLALPPLGSVFLLTDPAALAPAGAGASRPLDGRWELSVPGLPAIAMAGDPRLWTDLGERFSGFSGVATYRTTTDLKSIPRSRIELDLGLVDDLARVRVNGRDCGIVWTEPYRIDVTDALVDGTNVIEIEVANAWMNRLIAEAGEPSGAIFAPVTTVYEPDAPKHPSGLAGPVLLRAVSSGA